MTTKKLVSDDGPAHYLAIGGSKAGCVVLHESFGLNRYIAEICNKFADEGITAIAPDLFRRSPATAALISETDDRAEPNRAEMESLTAEGVLADVVNAKHILEANGASRLAIVGFCMGGTLATFCASKQDFEAVVVFYGGSIKKNRFAGVPPLVEVASQMRAPWLGLYGDRDLAAPIGDVAELLPLIQATGLPYGLNVYAGAGHGFHANYRESYCAQPANLAWNAATQWMRMYLASDGDDP